MIGPATAGRRLRIRLRDIRLGKGLSDAEVGEALGWPHARLPGIETGEVRIGLGSLRGLLAHYRVVDGDEVDRLVELQRSARRRHWADTYRQSYSPPFIAFLRFEADAPHIVCFHPRAVPGLLQTEAYARALIQGQGTALHSMTRRDVEVRVKARMRRQRAVLAADRRIEVALTELALLRPVSDDVAVMRTQLDHLVTLAQRSRVDLTLIPAGCGTPTGVGPFVVLNFDSVQDPDLVYLDDAPTDAALLDDSATVERYQQAFTDLRAHGVSGQQTVTRLTELREQAR